MPRSSNQPKRTRKNRQTRATLKPRAVSAAPETGTAGALASGTAGTSRGQALPYGGRAAAESGARNQSRQGLTITREQEYGFIREDLKRLLYTAAILLVVMFALLFLIDL